MPCNNTITALFNVHYVYAYRQMLFESNSTVSKSKRQYLTAYCLGYSDMAELIGYRAYPLRNRVVHEIKELDTTLSLVISSW